MLINNTLLTTAINIAKEIFSQQTAEDLATLSQHFGKAIDESKIVAEIAVKVLLRVGQIPYAQDVRNLSPIDDLALQAYNTYTQRFGG